MFNESEKELIKNVFGGDEQAFLSAHAKGRKETLKWEDIAASFKTLPELEGSAHELIIGLLGYLPPYDVTLPHEPFLRALFDIHRRGGYTFEELLLEAEPHVKEIRNKDVAENACITYDRDTYQQYFDYLPHYRFKVTDHLTRILGYEPKLEHSLVVELHLREALANDIIRLSEKISIRDIQAVTVIKYREALLTKGKVAADLSPLIARDFVMLLV